MTTFLIAIGAIIIVVAFLKASTVEETISPTVTPEDVKSAAVRERVYGEARLKKYGDVTEELRPKALKLWERAGRKIDTLVMAAETQGIEVIRESIGLEMHGATGVLFLNVDVTQLDPVFLLWTEDAETGESSELHRIKLLREVTERVSAWIQAN